MQIPYDTRMPLLRCSLTHNHASMDELEHQPIISYNQGRPTRDWIPGLCPELYHRNA